MYHVTDVAQRLTVIYRVLGDVLHDEWFKARVSEGTRQYDAVARQARRFRRALRWSVSPRRQGAKEQL